jgi:cytochrome P450
MQWWLVTRHADVMAVLGDHRFSAARIGTDLSWLPDDALATAGPVYRALARQILFLDPPDHTRIRALVNKAFTPRRVEIMRAHIQDLVNGLLDEAVARGSLDVIADLAYPLPTIVIADMLGVPRENREQFKRASDDLAAFLGNVVSADQIGRLLRSVAELLQYFQHLVAERRAQPRDDLMNALIAAEEQGDVLSEDELFANCLLLLAAGHETTTNLIGNGTLALLRKPAARQQLAEQLAIGSGLTTAGVNELLRYDSPVQYTGRVPTEDVVLAGTPIAKGQHVTILLGAANRDPAQFPDPDRLDLRRGENRHLAFGYGIHFCVGAPLARLEGQIAISTLFRRFPELQLATESVEWHANMSFHGVKALPVQFSLD